MTDQSLYMPFYYEWNEYLAVLTNEDFGKLVRAVLEFSKSGKADNAYADISPMAQMAYNFITSSIARSEQNRINGRKGGIARAEKAKMKYVPTSFGKNDDNESEKYTKVRENEKKEDKITTSDEKTVPSQDEVRNFFAKRGFKSNPDEFFNFYESKGWLVGQNEMKNWHAAAENWEIKAQKDEERAEKFNKTTPYPHQEEKPRHGDFDVDEAFRLALERSYGSLDDDDDE